MAQSGKGLSPRELARSAPGSADSAAEFDRLLADVRQTSDLTPSPPSFPTLDRWSQDPAFVDVQREGAQRWPAESAALEESLEQLLRSGSPFTAEDLVAPVGRDTLPPNLIGAFLGAHRAAGRIRVVGREKSRHPAAKGRWINRFAGALDIPGGIIPGASSP